MMFFKTKTKVKAFGFVVLSIILVLPVVLMSTNDLGPKGFANQRIIGDIFSTGENLLVTATSPYSGDWYYRMQRNEHGCVLVSKPSIKPDGYSMVYKDFSCDGVVDKIVLSHLYGIFTEEIKKPAHSYSEQLKQLENFLVFKRSALHGNTHVRGSTHVIAGSGS